MRLSLIILAILYAAIVAANEQFFGDLSHDVSNSDELDQLETENVVGEAHGNDNTDRNDHIISESMESEESMLDMHVTTDNDDATNEAQVDETSGLLETVDKPIESIKAESQTALEHLPPQSNYSAKSPDEVASEVGKEAEVTSLPSQQLSISYIKDVVIKFLEQYNDDITFFVFTAAVPALIATHIINHKLM